MSWWETSVKWNEKTKPAIWGISLSQLIPTWVTGTLHGSNSNNLNIMEIRYVFVYIFGLIIYYSRKFSLLGCLSSASLKSSHHRLHLLMRNSLRFCNKAILIWSTQVLPIIRVLCQIVIFLQIGFTWCPPQFSPRQSEKITEAPARYLDALMWKEKVCHHIVAWA